MLCCNKRVEDCQCSDPMTFAESISVTEEFFLESKEDLHAYAYDSFDDYSQEAACESCVYHATFRCKPYRDWIRDLSESSHMNIPESSKFLMPCQQYDPKTSATEFEKAEVFDYLTVGTDPNQDMEITYSYISDDGWD